jgi:aminoglycoside phosphotransferase (APT) family kinase protein
MTTEFQTRSPASSDKSAADFDVAALEAYLDEHIPGFEGPLRAMRIEGGQSNPTYHLFTPLERYVLRRKPQGVLLPSAHAIEREYRLLTALADTDVPVPRALCLCEDAAIVGTPFYVMAYVPGRTLWNPALPGCSREERQAMYRELNRVLAALHGVDVAAVGLQDYGRPGNYFERQVSRWTKQYRATETESIPAMDQLAVWLAERVPPSSAVSLLHGDFRLDNMLFHPESPRIVAVLDWELSTLGDPLADLAYHATTWLLSFEEFRGMAGHNLAELGIPSQEEYVAAYCQRRGIQPPSSEQWSFAVACSLFRLAAILQGVRHRALQGNASSSDASSVGQSARVVAEAAWRYIQTHVR